MRIPTWLLLFGGVLLLGMVGKTSLQAQATAPKPAVAKTTKAPAKAVAKKATKTPKVATKTSKKKSTSGNKSLSGFLIGLYIFMLAIFVGFEVITKVPPTLHTPLMSGANAISGIAIVGALQCTRTTSFTAAKILGFLAIVFAMINVVGGFLVTDRMLKMFSKR